jgi:hypothetical protein
VGLLMEPVDPVDDFLTTRGTVAQCTLRYYDVSKDIGGTEDPWEPAIEIRGSHGVERTWGGKLEGDTVLTETDWYISSLSPDVILERPELRSKILSCGKVWIILEIDPNPRNRRLFYCPRCQLSPAG